MKLSVAFFVTMVLTVMVANPAHAYDDGTYQCVSVHTQVTIRSVQIADGLTLPYLEFKMGTSHSQTLKGFGTVIDNTESQVIRLNDYQITFFNDHRDNGCVKLK